MNTHRTPLESDDAEREKLRAKLIECGVHAEDYTPDEMFGAVKVFAAAAISHGRRAELRAPRPDFFGSARYWRARSASPDFFGSARSAHVRSASPSAPIAWSDSTVCTPMDDEERELFVKHTSGMIKRETALALLDKMQANLDAPGGLARMRTLAEARNDRILISMLHMIVESHKPKRIVILLEGLCMAYRA